MNEKRLIPLAFMQPGESGSLVEIRGLRHRNRAGESALPGATGGVRRRRHRHSDRGHRLEHRLKSMGLVPGENVRVVQNSATGQVIVAVKDSRLYLGRGIASRLMVRPGDAPPPEAGPSS